MRKRSAKVATANVLYVRKRSVTSKYFICTKAKRQQQKFYMCESEATATTLF
ncbi:hypothetical protein [Lysinibacillus sp. fls2-241-R2A-57]|uniref:hypothetical protein n=1 Tax=Lysinibacillus sp. fls2-241-R2A-57 TaxID=3040292 RepID=UPI0025530A39|nr:hypothetical protein [Lysinibacillus sp. fls2-241-R2A-57]